MYWKCVSIRTCLKIVNMRIRVLILNGKAAQLLLPRCRVENKQYPNVLMSLYKYTDIQLVSLPCVLEMIFVVHITWKLCIGYLTWPAKVHDSSPVRFPGWVYTTFTIYHKPVSNISLEADVMVVLDEWCTSAGFTQCSVDAFRPTHEIASSVFVLLFMLCIFLSPDITS